MENEDIRKLLEKIEKENSRQEEYRRKQYEMTRIMAICAVAALVVVIISVLIMVPKIMGTFNQLSTILNDVESVSKSLNNQLPLLIESTGKLIGDNNSGLIEAIESFNSFDIEGLNGAINGLKTAIEPLIKLFGY